MPWKVGCKTVARAYVDVPILPVNEFQRKDVKGQEFNDGLRNRQQGEAADQRDQEGGKVKPPDVACGRKTNAGTT